jgi:hypothetical protein
MGHAREYLAMLGYSTTVRSGSVFSAAMNSPEHINGIGI